MEIAEFVAPGDVTRYITFHKTLNPKLWQANQLRLDARVALLKIALQFYTFLETPGLVVQTVIITGSNVAFNYTPLSDIDVHMIVDFEHSACPTLADNFFTTKKTLWNKTRDINIRGINVELYVEDTKNPVKANGVYDLVAGRWLRTPTPVAPTYDDTSVISKTEQYADEIDTLLDARADIGDLEALSNRLRMLRQSGLSNGGEFSVENLAYKSLRNLGYLDKLAQAKLHSQSDSLSL